MLALSLQAMESTESTNDTIMSDAMHSEDVASMHDAMLPTEEVAEEAAAVMKKKMAEPNAPEEMDLSIEQTVEKTEMPVEAATQEPKADVQGVFEEMTREEADENFAG